MTKHVDQQGKTPKDPTYTGPLKGTEDTPARVHEHADDGPVRVKPTPDKHR